VSVTRILPWVLLLGLIAFAAGTYGNLPGEVPVHIGANGVRLEERSVLSWAMVPIIAFGVALLLEVVAMMLPSRPHLFNFPEKERLLQLPREYQGEAIARMLTALHVISAMTMAVLFSAQWMLWRVAHGHPEGGGLVLLVLGGVLTGPIGLLMVSRVSTAVEAAERRWRDSGVE
jgi:hypothetical protein